MHPLPGEACLTPFDSGSRIRDVVHAPAIHGKGLGRDEARLGRNQEGHCVGDIFRYRRAPAGQYGTWPRDSGARKSAAGSTAILANVASGAGNCMTQSNLLHWGRAASSSVAERNLLASVGCNIAMDGDSVSDSGA